MLEVRSYTPASPLRHLPDFFGGMMRDGATSSNVAWRLFVRDINAQYRQTIFGFLWFFVPPIVASLPFIFLHSQGVVAVSAIPVPYAAFAMIGTFLWQSFVDALGAPLKTMLNSRSMITRINLPLEALLMSAFLQTLFMLLVRLILLFAIFVWFGIAPAATAPLAALAMLSLILFGFVIGVLLSPLGMLYGDIQQSLPLVTSFMMLLTPVVYPPVRSGVIGAITAWNPLAAMVGAARDWLLTGSSEQAPAALAAGGASLLLFLFGWLAFKVAMPHLVARLGN